MKCELQKTFTFEAAHQLPRVPAGHKCARLHGHSFRVTLIVRGEIDPEFGWVMDYAEMKRVAQPFIEQLDHRYLNEIEGLENPTSEILAQWLFERIHAQLPLLAQITVHETCTTACTFPTTP